jgi:glycosyltransferase involved in cell wall biosynthesis
VFRFLIVLFDVLLCMKKPRVLMLGWEFPPVINGGLGVACHDLCLAMAKHAKVTMIIPKSNPDFVVKDLQLIGLDTIDSRTLRHVNYKEEYKTFEDVHFIPSDLNPYYTERHKPFVIPGVDMNSQYLKEIKVGSKKAKVFHIDDLYGGDVIEKVTVFGQLASRLAMTLDFDIIHAHDWMTMLAGMEVKEKTGKPLVVHVHSLEVDRGGVNSQGWVYQMEKRGMQVADVLMPVSNFTGNIINEYYGIDYRKIFPIHNGIREVKPFRSKSPYKEKLVLFIGRLTRQKGPEYFVDIAAKVLEKNPNVRFIMAGTGDAQNKVLEKVAQKRIGSRFHLAGFLGLDKVRFLLSIADVYCMPSVSEPFGLSAVEAAQFDVPVVISKQSGVAEVLSGALKFDFWDINHAAEYILSVLDDDTLKQQVIDDAGKDLKNISWDIAAAKVFEGYKKYELY